MGAPRVAPKTSSSKVARPTTISVPELDGTSRSLSFWQTAGSLEESNNKTQRPDDAIFMYERTAN